MDRSSVISLLIVFCTCELISSQYQLDCEKNFMLYNLRTSEKHNQSEPALHDSSLESDFLASSSCCRTSSLLCRRACRCSLSAIISLILLSSSSSSAIWAARLSASEDVFEVIVLVACVWPDDAGGLFAVMLGSCWSSLVKPAAITGVSVFAALLDSEAWDMSCPAVTDRDDGSSAFSLLERKIDVVREPSSCVDTWKV